MTAYLVSAAGYEFETASVYEKLFSREDEATIRNWGIRETAPICSPKTSCDTNLFFGFFFDGTGNNYLAAEKTKDHSNIARLYDCFPGMSVPGVLPKSTNWQYKPEQYKHFFRVYVPGPGTTFRQANDSGAGTDKTFGGASGRLGKRRIIWALVQVINNVHRFFLQSSLISQSEIDNLFDTIANWLQTLCRLDAQPCGAPDYFASPFQSGGR